MSISPVCLSDLLMMDIDRHTNTVANNEYDPDRLRNVACRLHASFHPIHHNI